MSAALEKEVMLLAKQTAVSVCWTQWVGMGSSAAPVHHARPKAIIDPEALILLSLYVSEAERRLNDMVAWWAESGSRLTSLTRMKAVSARFPRAAGNTCLGTFSAMAWKAGDRRWAGPASLAFPVSTRARKGPERLRVIDPSALWPRLRAAFGVGAKADTLVFLIGMGGAWASAKVIAFATGYSSVSIRKAASEMALARLIRETDSRPVEYLTPPKPWGELLELYPQQGRNTDEPSTPPWRFWSEVFAFLAGAIEWAKDSRSNPGLIRVRASKARDLVERHKLAFDLSNIHVPHFDAFPAQLAPEGLLETTRSVSSWIEQMV